MILALVLMFVLVGVATFFVVRWRGRRVTVVAPVTSRVRSSSPYRTPSRRQPSRGF
jgi:hypothetical protein